MDGVIKGLEHNNRGLSLMFSTSWAFAHRRLLAATASALVLCAGFLLSGCGGVSRSATVDQVGATTPVVVGSGDVIRITFTATPEYNQSQKIRSDGRISLPQIGEVYVAGKTLAQLGRDLEGLYRSQVKNTDVMVTLESAATQVYVSGSVRSPGKFTFDRPVSILQAIMEAGGANQFGNLRSVHLIRTTNGVQRTQLVDLRPALAGHPTAALYVKNGDIIQVPQSPF